jgi:hypothetical protein
MKTSIQGGVPWTPRSYPKAQIRQGADRVSAPRPPGCKRPDLPREGGPGHATTHTGGRGARHDQVRGNAQ